MKTLQSYITEGVSEGYHFTHAESLIKILKSDTYKCSKDDGYNPQGYDYYMSTTRSQNANTGYSTGFISDKNVVKLIIDNNKLSHTYKIIPIDMMRGKWRAIKTLYKDPKVFDQNYNELMKQVDVEAEDRILSKSSDIKNFSKYIKRIIINNDNIEPSLADDVIRYADKKNIEVRIANSKEFKNAK